MFSLIKRFVIYIFLIMPFSSVLFAQDEVAFELAPHTGFMDGGGEFGLDLGMNYKSISLEFSGAQVIGKTSDLFPLNVNLILNFATKGKIIPFGGVGAGLLLTVPTTTVGNKTLSNLGINFGGGLRYYISDDFGLKFGVNQYLTNIKNARDNYEELLIFQEVVLGVIFVFK
jgi:hypothetical protein